MRGSGHFPWSGRSRGRWLGSAPEATHAVRRRLANRCSFLLLAPIRLAAMPRPLLPVHRVGGILEADMPPAMVEAVSLDLLRRDQIDVTGECRVERPLP